MLAGLAHCALRRTPPADGDGPLRLALLPPWRYYPERLKPLLLPKAQGIGRKAKALAYLDGRILNPGSGIVGKENQHGCAGLLPVAPFAYCFLKLLSVAISEY